MALDDIRFELAAADVGREVPPGDPDGCVNDDGHGVIPAAILSSAAFDATRADPATLRLEGMEVATRGDGRRPLVSEEDVDGDGRPDLVAKFDDEAGTWSGDEVEARLTGETADDGTPFRGSDRVCLVP